MVEILLERLTPESAWPLAIFSRWRNERRAGVLATVLRVEGESVVRVGQRLALGEDGEVCDDVANELHDRLLQDTHDVLNVTAQCSDEEPDRFIRVMRLPYYGTVSVRQGSAKSYS